MGNVNETAFGACRFLDDSHLGVLYETFVRAFEDYVVPFALTEAQFRSHILLNGVDLKRTAGCFDGERLVGFSLNGFGVWNGIETVYDAGTGVVPAYRRRGISEAMFEMMLPRFKADGIRQCLLEVITLNDAAINLYQKLGFTTLRTLALLQCDTPLASRREAPAGVEVREMDEPDWDLFRTFWDTQPSWQNSPDAITRSTRVKRVIGAFKDGCCVGYIACSPSSGRLAQLAVDRDHRGQGIGTALVRAMQSETAEGFSLQVINIDRSDQGSMEFFERIGFYVKLSQFEMVLRL
jgi:ribosomal protein S18 acetylase RimI-like enzyme